MSQKKVDEYKRQKANRAQIMRKEKRMFRLEVVVLVLVVAALVGWFSVAVYRQSKANAPVEVSTTTIRTDAIDEYMEGIENPEDAEAEAAVEEEAEAEAEEEAQTEADAAEPDDTTIAEDEAEAGAEAE